MERDVIIVGSPDTVRQKAEVMTRSGSVSLGMFQIANMPHELTGVDETLFGGRHARRHGAGRVRAVGTRCGGSAGPGGGIKKPGDEPGFFFSRL